MTTRPDPTPDAADEAVPPAPSPWDPDAAAEAHPGLRVVEHPLAALFGGGFVVRREHRHVVVLDPDLHPWQRRAALAHELVHAERGLVDRADAPDGWDHEVRREERAVALEVADRLAPPGVVRELVARRRRAGEPVTALDVATELEVPVEVAELALRAFARQGGRVRPGGRR